MGSIPLIGQIFCHYYIAERIGAGGMGEVYRARDTRLNRDVALKVLPEVFARGGERMARFRREAQVLASLNHPNIATIYGLEESNGNCALVMELVEDRLWGSGIGRRTLTPGPSPGGRGGTVLCEIRLLPWEREKPKTIGLALSLRDRVVPQRGTG